MRVALGADHAGYDLKQSLIKALETAGHQVTDLGAHSTESVDYPPICAAVGRAVATGEADRGIVLGGIGQGEQIAANKVPGARAALVWNLSTARLAREHNDANVISIGAREHTIAAATSFIDAFVAEPFSDEERHTRRIRQLGEYERTGTIAGKNVDGR